jgi:hypothetical protein
MSNSGGFFQEIRITVQKHSAVFLGFFLTLPLSAAPPKTRSDTPYPAKVSDNRRYLLDRDGKPFFWLGDTAWELFHRLNREEAEEYLKDRADKKFNVIQAVVLAEFAGLTEPNRYGHLPLEKNDPAKPVEAYFRHVDWIVNKADELGLAIGMLPTWGDKWNKKWGEGRMALPSGQTAAWRAPRSPSQHPL